ncbi:hypothetical protein BDW02DRAFT_570924 [Decorospora gaudefroyi]|uniref:Origin recognition complex subunit 4 n=1 Tax=Decorospora gaudefroyi TaxID=184978 RepID=A0A6A5KBH6_9PLEO|nr:hypothetical protein BDW02DRAFT_570924 [Decorospora gaudefroyi]
MDDSPRASKRRKLDSPKRRGRPPKSTTNGTRAKQTAADDIDVYDDIEGALHVATSPRPARRSLQTRSREGTAGTDELQASTTPPKRRRGRPTKAESASRAAFRNVAKGYRNGAKKEPRPAAEKKEELEELEELQDGVNGTTRSKPRSTRKTARRDMAPHDAEQEEATKATPSRWPKRRKPTEEPTTVPETEDELGHAAPTRSRKPTASARRRMNRADHITNHDEEHWSNAEEQASGHHEDDEDDDDDDDDSMEVDGNSLLGSVLDPTEPSPFNKPTSAQKEKLVPSLIHTNLPAGRELDLLKTVVMERITGKRASPLVGLDEEYKAVHQLVEHTITAGEGNSMLVIGARGSGKTALVNNVLSEVSKDNGGQYHVVRLSGFLHTDDKIALRDIWRQLGKEMDIEEDGSGPGKNYADTLATLLALLSHPSEQTGEVTDQVAKAVIFVMDEFDLFAHHPRQTLLYNLFDIAQSRKAPIAVLGLTTRIDVTNSLEKRVKSRFSHRYVHLRLATTFTAFQDICKACLLIQPEQLSVEERGILEAGTKTTPGKKGKKDAKQDVLTEWNANISKLFATPSFLTTHLAPPFYLTKSIPQILTSFLLPTATISTTTPFTPTNALTAPDSKLSLIPHLSTLSLSLLIAAARLDIIHDSDTCNFNMAYDEYVTLASRARIQSAAGGLSSSSSTSKVWGKDVGRREWEGLVELGLVMPVVQGQVGAFGMVRCDVALEEVGEVLKGIRGADRGLERWCKSI